MNIDSEENVGLYTGVSNGFLTEDLIYNEDDMLNDSAYMISDKTNMTNDAVTTRDEVANGHEETEAASNVYEENELATVTPKHGTNECRNEHEWYTLTRDEVPLLFRESYVEGGFRPINKPWSFYLRSAFHIHNEFMNVWTHIIAIILTSVQLWLFSKRCDFINDPYAWPMLAGMLCGISLYACSTFAHCCQSRSEFIHYIAFMIDYAGIGLYGLGSVIVHLTYCCEEDFYNAVNGFYIPLGCAMSFLISCCHSMAKVKYSRPYPFARKLWQITPILGIYVVLISPIAHRLNACYSHGIDCTESIPYHFQQITWFFTSGFFFASDIPQRFLHGKCDIFWHSHQLFHVAIAMCTLFQMQGVYIDFKTRGHVIRSRPAPTFFSAFGPVLIVLALEALCILFFSTRVAKKLKDSTAKTD